MIFVTTVLLIVQALKLKFIQAVIHLSILLIINLADWFAIQLIAQ